MTWGVGPQGVDVILTQKTPFRHVGGTLSAIMSPGGPLVESGFRLLIGAGVYRVSDVEGQRADLTRGAVHVGLEKSLTNPASRLVGYIGLRSIWFPELGGSGVLHFPLELGLRVR